MKIKVSKFILATACACSLVACAKENPKLTISVENNISSIHRAEEIQIKSAMEHVEGKVTYTVSSNKDTEEIKYATISETGLLRCSEEAPVGAIITVEGKVNGVNSNPLTFTVQHTYPQSIEIVATGSDGKVKENFASSLDEITLTTLFTPAYATVKTVQYSITSGSQFAKINEENVVSLKAGIEFEGSAKNQVVGVKATVVNPDTSAAEVSATKSLVINGIFPDNIELSAKIDDQEVTSIKRKDEIVLSRAFTCNNQEEPTIKTTTYEFESGKDICTISKEVLKLKDIDLTPYYGTKIKFRAVLNADESIVSNWVELTVEELKTYVDINVEKEIMKANEKLSLDIDCQDGSTNEFNIFIEKGKGDDIAELVDGTSSTNKVLQIKDGQAYNATDRSITVTAVSKNDPEIKDSITISVIVELAVSVTTMNFVDGVTVNNHVTFRIFKDGKELAEDKIDKSKLSFESLNTEIFTIDGNGYITALNHGTGKVKVTYDGVASYGDVNVMVIPTSVKIDLGLTKTYQANHKYAYSKNETLKLNISASNIDNKKTTNSFKFKFEKMVDGAPVASGDSVAVIDSEKNVTFKTTGEIKLTVTSSSSLNNENTTAYEKQDYMIFDINEGVNVRTQEDLKKLNYAKNQTINFINDIYLSGDAFGLTTNKAYVGLLFYGTTKINGNGFKISAENLAFHSEAEDGATNNLFTFYPEGLTLDGENSRVEENKAWSVSVKDLEFVGMFGVTGTYTGSNGPKTQQVINLQTGKPKNAFEKAMQIGYGDFYAYAGLRVSSSCLENVVIENCNVHNFRFGVRIEHAIYALVKDTYVGECFESGIIFSQCFATLENPWFGQVGTFAIEMTPDAMMDKNTTNPKGCAGRDYNQTATLYLNGDIVRDGASSVLNYNNGSSTPAMMGVSQQLQGNTVPAIINQLTSGIIQAVAQGNETAANMLNTAAANCLYKDGDASAANINFFLLIFVNPADFGSYKVGNQENKFGIFTTNNTQANMITLVDLLIGIATKAVTAADYQYIRVDLDIRSAIGADIGDAIIVNQAYKGLAK